MNAAAGGTTPREVEGDDERPTRGRSDSAEAFLPDPGDGAPSHAADDLAETLAEDFVRSATTGENAEDELLELAVPEEIGGPFVETSAGEEFADGDDASNPEGATPEPLPRAVTGLSQGPREPD